MLRPVLLDAILALPLFPLLALQASHVRRTTPRLPEPDGFREGRRGEVTPLRLLILGDSAAAGVGASHQDEALLGCLVRELADLPALDWRLIARTGDTTADTLRTLRALPDLRCDVVVTSLGVNDVTKLRGARAFVALQQQLIEHLRTRCGARRILISGLPPMHAFRPCHNRCAASSAATRDASMPDSPNGSRRSPTASTCRSANCPPRT